jgi:hypothetical protein
MLTQFVVVLVNKFLVLVAKTFPFSAELIAGFGSYVRE